MCVEQIKEITKKTKRGHSSENTGRLGIFENNVPSTQLSCLLPLTIVSNEALVPRYYSPIGLILYLLQNNLLHVHDAQKINKNACSSEEEYNSGVLYFSFVLTRAHNLSFPSYKCKCSETNARKNSVYCVLSVSKTDAVF